MGAPDAAMSFTDQGDGQPTLNVAGHPQVGLIQFCRGVDGYNFKCILCRHAFDAIHQHAEG